MVFPDQPEVQNIQNCNAVSLIVFSYHMPVHNLHIFSIRKQVNQNQFFSKTESSLSEVEKRPLIYVNTQPFIKAIACNITNSATQQHK